MNTETDYFRAAIPGHEETLAEAEKRNDLARRALAGDEDAEVRLAQLLADEESGEWV